MNPLNRKQVVRVLVSGDSSNTISPTSLLCCTTDVLISGKEEAVQEEERRDSRKESKGHCNQVNKCFPQNNPILASAGGLFLV